MNKLSDIQHEAFEIVNGDYGCGLLLLADHASNYIPPEYEKLGLQSEALERHIAYDIGVREFTIGLAKALNVPAVLSKFSRLLIDPNRGSIDPTLVMRLADGEIVAGNRDIDSAEKQNRLSRFYQPYDEAISMMIGQFEAIKIRPTLFAIHSFTPFWRGNKRDTEVGLLWHENKSFTADIMAALARSTDYIVDENKPYFGGLNGDTMDRHGLQKDLEHSLLELRQDLLSNSADIAEWVAVFAGILPEIMKNRQNKNRME